MFIIYFFLCYLYDVSIKYDSFLIHRKCYNKCLNVILILQNADVILIIYSLFT